MMAVASYGDKDYYKCKYCRYVAPFSSIQTQNYTYQSRNSNTHLVTNNTTGLSYSFSESHTFEYISNNKSQHIKRCKYCNYQVMELHSFECVHNSGLLTHSNRCTKCNYSYTESHTYNYSYTTTSHTKTCSSTNYQIQEGHYINYYLNSYYPITNDDLKHKVICECGGVNKLSSHVCSSADINNGYPNTCLDCGKSITSGMGLIGPNGTSNIIKRTNNGSYILRNGIIVLAEVFSKQKGTNIDSGVLLYDEYKFGGIFYEIDDIVVKSNFVSKNYSFMMWPFANFVYRIKDYNGKKVIIESDYTLSTIKNEELYNKISSAIIEIIDGQYGGKKIVYDYSILRTIFETI